MNYKQGKLLLRLTFRGSLLFLLLVWFAHLKLSTPHQQANVDPETFTGRLAHKANITEAQARVVLMELGPAITRELLRDHEVRLPQLGRFRRGAKEYQNSLGFTVDYQPSPDLLKIINPLDVVGWDGFEPQPAKPANDVKPAVHHP